MEWFESAEDKAEFQKLAVEMQAAQKAKDKAHIDKNVNEWVVARMKGKEFKNNAMAGDAYMAACTRNLDYCQKKEAEAKAAYLSAQDVLKNGLDMSDVKSQVDSELESESEVEAQPSEGGTVPKSTQGRIKMLWGQNTRSAKEEAELESTCCLNKIHKNFCRNLDKGATNGNYRYECLNKPVAAPKKVAAEPAPKPFKIGEPEWMKEGQKTINRVGE